MTQAYKSRYYRTKLVFSGKKIHFPVWEEKFLAKSRSKGYREVLLGHTTIPKESEIIDETSDQGKKDLLI
jgi:hypothetical protein